MTTYNDTTGELDVFGDDQQTQHPGPAGQQPAARTPIRTTEPFQPVPPVQAGTPTPTSSPAPASRHTYDEEELAERQRERFGGLNWGAGFFGSIVAAGVTLILAAAGATALSALGLATQVLPTQPTSSPGTPTIIAAAVLVAALLLGYFAGGYVAGRMSRFDGGRQGIAVWISGLLLTGLAGGLLVLLAAQYDLLSRVQLPTVVLPPQVLGPVAWVVGGVTLLGTLLAAAAGGGVGLRYHRKVDEAGRR